MPAKLKPFVVEAGEGRTVEGPAGGPVQFKAAGNETGGNLVAFVNRIGPREGPPLHQHSGCDEAWFVMEGRFRFKLGDQVYDAPVGSFVFVPRGTDHCFQNIGDESANLLVLFTPAGMEKFFEEFAALPPGPFDPHLLDEMAGRAGMKITGPPLR